jgi:hypothetical protein
MRYESPFTLSRFEHERIHLYFLPGEVFSRLEGAKPTYLIGSRGTGKTTLLTALSWKEQLNNPYLSHKLSGAGNRGYIGIYIRTPEFILASLDRTHATIDEISRATLFAYYLDLVWLKELADALATLLVRGVIRASIAQEQDVIERILEAQGAFLGVQKTPEARTLKELSRLFESAKRVLERTIKLPMAAERFMDLLPNGQIGEFGRSIATLMSDFCETNTPTMTGIHFKICLDEAECLTLSQQRVINSMVRLSRYPVSFIISYVRPMEDMTNTLIPGMTIQKADREIIPLDELSDEKFRVFCEGVASVRIERQMVRRSVRFRTRTVLGDLDINSLLLSLLKSSASPSARELLASAVSTQRDASAQNTAISPEKPSAPPIYQTYLLRKRDVDVVPQSAEPWQRRGQDSAELRKRMVAAYLLICKEHQFNVKYASADMLIQMSDRCVRDYLSQMHEVFVTSAVPLETFLKKRLSVDKQDVSLRGASLQKKGSLPISGLSAPQQAELLVDGLAQLTERLQTDNRRGRALGSPERGVFRLSVNGTHPQLKEALRLIREAAEAGFLKILERSEDQWKFRVHCSLAAAYSFSYRGAYYPTSITLQDLTSFYSQTDEAKRALLVASIADGAGGNSETLPLFEEQ